MLALITTHSRGVLIGIVIAAVVLLSICLFFKLFKIAIGVGALACVIFVLFTVFWGDGTEYVSKLTSFMEPEHQQRVEEAYQYYKEKDAEDPIVDYDAVSSAVTDIFGGEDIE